MWAYLCFLLVPLAWAAREEDRVTFLPDLDPQPEFNHYAGYLQASETKQHFYWFVESENDPATDPLVLWLNGGPGCSSMTGFLVELGPWRIRPDGSGLDWFEHRWNKIANMIFMESPACVGFSYDTNYNCTSSDEQSAIDNHNALKDFLEGFPEYQGRDFFIAGQSYAGVYVPALARLIMNDDDFNFIGFAVGNAVTSRRIMSNSNPIWAYARGIFGNDMWTDLVDECCVDGNSSNCNFYDHESEECSDLTSTVNDLVWRSGLNPYNIYFNCPGFSPPEDGENMPFLLPDEMSLSKREYEEAIEKLMFDEGDGYQGFDPPCSNATNRRIYLNRPDVREALHVPEFVHQWDACSRNVSSTYVRTMLYMQEIYHEILNEGYRGQVYSGDMDGAVDQLGSHIFMEDLGLEEVSPYQAWYAPTEDGTTQIAGYATEYANIKFATVKGSGHNVPEDRPIAAYTLWEKFINDDSFPYKP